jgi:hypothetical protein
VLAIVGDRAHAYVSTRHSAAPVPAQMDTGGRDAWSARRGGSERIACRNVIGGPASTVFASRTEVASVGRASLVTNAGSAMAICMGRSVYCTVIVGRPALATESASEVDYATVTTRGWVLLAANAFQVFLVKVVTLSVQASRRVSLGEGAK